MSGFVCRPCFWAYESYITKGNKLYEAIESNCLRLLCSSIVQEVTKQSEPTKKRKKTVGDATTPNRRHTISGSALFM